MEIYSNTLCKVIRSSSEGTREVRYFGGEPEQIEDWE